MRRTLIKLTFDGEGGGLTQGAFSFCSDDGHLTSDTAIHYTDFTAPHFCISDKTRPGFSTYSSPKIPWIPDSRIFIFMTLESL